ncbi:hypothetical protein GCM10023196_049510 [Actinoallomurus vinaceus]|uniref:Bulb-type lectin domain-containing protein n=1 Tax=Actinoallomurus vinaceus TaxID=1080074 RepID=A0ABP8UD46_9ACTN
MALSSLRGGTTLARAVTLCGIAAAATGLLATSASADTVCAFFTSSQSDWYAWNNTTWGSWVLSKGPSYNSIYIKFQSDGNLVVYRQRDNAVMWASGTWGRNVTDLDWSVSAGGILLKRADGSVVCQIGEGASTGRAQVQEDGNFVFYNDVSEATWSIWGTPYTTNYCNVSH